jgi:predicted DNA-binding transcriptional regulator AlpA
MPRPEPKIPPRLLRLKRASAYTGLSVKFLRRLILTGQLPHLQMERGGNSPFLLDVRDVDHWIATHKT